MKGPFFNSKYLNGLTLFDWHTIISYHRMKDLGETTGRLLLRGAEGECENSQAEGPDLDDTLESDLAPTKQCPVYSVYIRNYRKESFR